MASARALAGLLLVLSLSRAAAAQVRPFAFTGDDDCGCRRQAWTPFYDAGYGERTSDPFGFDGLEQRLGVQGRLRAGFTVVGRLGFGVGPGDEERSTQEAEILMDVLARESGLRLAFGLGARREWQGGTTALARLSVGRAAPGSLLFGNVRLEKPFAASRYTLDVMTTLGWMLRAGRGLGVGVEAVGEDLEGLWDAREAEGGAKLYVGPALHWAKTGERLWASLGGGPSSAPRAAGGRARPRALSAPPATASPSASPVGLAF